jgi:hypothetical protein
MSRQRHALVSSLFVAVPLSLIAAVNCTAGEIPDFSFRPSISGNNRGPRILYENWDEVDFHRTNYDTLRSGQFLLDDVRFEQVPAANPKSFFQLRIDLLKSVPPNAGDPFPPAHWRVPATTSPISSDEPPDLSKSYKLLNP